jgi:phage tail-like protein
MAMNTLGKEKKDGMSSYFKVVMEDYEEVIFQSCDGLQSEIEVVYVVEGGRASSPHALRGLPKSNKIIFSKGNLSAKNGKKSLFDWFQEVSDYSKPLKRQTLTIQLLNTQKAAIRTWRVVDAWPCRWMGPTLSRDNSDLTVEYIEFAHEGITV